MSHLLKKPEELNLSKESFSSSSNTELAVDAVVEIENQEWKESIYDIIRTIRDPEKPNTLEELKVVDENLIEVSRLEEGNRDQSSIITFHSNIGFCPTVPHCSLATLIGLCLRTKLEQQLPKGQFKIDLYIKPGTHNTEAEITKQINDKERVSAAMENPNLRQTVNECIQEEE